ncbi:unnamed protein product, partial [marine sediment metagenome]
MTDWGADWWKLSLIGGGSGALGGLVGGGADALVVPLLVLLKVFKSYKLAIGTSLAMLLPPVGVFAVVEYWRAKCKYKKDKQAPCINWGYAMFLAAAFTVGSWIVAKYAVELDADTMRTTYGAFLLVLGCVILVDEHVR